MSCDLFQLATQGVQGLQPYQPGKPLEELEREYGIKDAIKLASNENPLGISPKVATALQEALPQLNFYPDGNGFRLKQGLAEKDGVSPNMITLGNGSNDVLELIARAFATSAHSIVFSQHAFAVYPIVTQAIGATAIKTPALNWGHDLNAMLAAIREDTRIVFIANPNNPTGTCLDKTELKAFLAAVPDNALVVMDEAYFEFVDDPNYPNSIEWINEHPNLIVCRTFSKAYGLAGLRVGYSVSHPDVSNILNRVRQPFNVNSLALLAAEVALTDKDFLQRSIAVNKEGLTQVSAQLEALGIGYIPSVGNFIAVDVGQPAAPIYEGLLRKGVIVRPVAAYEMPNHLRVSIGLSHENARFIEALKQVLGR